MLLEQKQAIAEARREAAELIKANQEAVEKARGEMLAKSRAEAEALVAVAKRQIDEEKIKAVAEVRGLAVDLAVLGARRLVESSLDEKKQRELVADFIGKLEARAKPTA
jgi:F-type H+-transporting ATPase subunit b